GQHDRLGAAVDGCLKQFERSTALLLRRRHRCAACSSLSSWLFCLIILSAGKELFPPHRCRRSAGSGFHFRPDGPRRKEHIWGPERTLGLLPPMETPEAL